MAAETIAQPVKRGFIHHLKTSLMAGLLVVVPVGITIFILKFLTGKQAICSFSF